MTDAGCESDDRPRIPATAVKGRRTPTFSLDTVPAALTRAHVTTTWAELVVLAGSVPLRRRDAAADCRYAR